MAFVTAPDGVRLHYELVGAGRLYSCTTSSGRFGQAEGDTHVRLRGTDLAKKGTG